MCPLPSLHAQVRPRDGEPFEGQCTDLDFRTDDVVALIEFDTTRAPAIAIGERARISLRGPAFTSPIDADAITVLRTDNRTRRCYSFRMTKVSKALLMLLANRRSSDRVRPPVSRPVRIRLLDARDGGTSEAIVHDISATGLSVLVEPDLERHYCNRVQLCLSILLPEAEPVEATATIRHRRLFGSAILYGLEFNGQIPGFMHAQERLLSYLANVRSNRT